MSPEQRVLHFVLYLKHDNIVQLEAYGWNYAPSSSCNDAIFVASCLNEALEDELSWPDERRRSMLAARLPEFQGCIGHIDGTLVQIRRPSSKDKKKLHKKWYNGRKAIYAFNNTVIIDHDGHLSILIQVTRDPFMMLTYFGHQTSTPTGEIIFAMMTNTLNMFSETQDILAKRCTS